MSLLTEHILVMGAFLFVTGLVGFLTRRSMILMFLSLELMLVGVSLNFIAFSRHHDQYQGQIFAILVLTVAACEAALALALIVALFRQKPTLDVIVWGQLAEVPRRPRPDHIWNEEPKDADLPTLAPAGLDPLAHPAPTRLGQTPAGQPVQEVTHHG